MTVIYLSAPSNRKMLSEEIEDQKVPADIVKTVRKKFFEWSEGIAMAKIFPNESRDADIMLVEILTPKLTQS